MEQRLPIPKPQTPNPTAPQIAFKYSQILNPTHYQTDAAAALGLF